MLFECDETRLCKSYTSARRRIAKQQFRAVKMRALSSARCIVMQHRARPCAFVFRMIAERLVLALRGSFGVEPLNLRRLSHSWKAGRGSFASSRSEEDSSHAPTLRWSFFLSFFFPVSFSCAPSHRYVWLYISLVLIIANRHGRSRFIGTASLLRQKIGMQLMERQEGTRAIYIEFNARFTSAQFHRRPTTVLKGVLNRRVVKESHRDAAYKGIPPTLSPSLFFFLFSSTFGASIYPVWAFFSCPIHRASSRSALLVFFFFFSSDLYISFSSSEWCNLHVSPFDFVAQTFANGFLEICDSIKRVSRETLIIETRERYIWGLPRDKCGLSYSFIP